MFPKEISLDGMIFFKTSRVTIEKKRKAKYRITDKNHKRLKRVSEKCSCHKKTKMCDVVKTNSDFVGRFGKDVSLCHEEAQV